MPHIQLEASKRVPDIVSGGGRRSEGRQKTVYRPCSITFADKQNFGIIRNLSEGGASIECSFELGVGDTIEYSDGDNSRVTGTIVWAKDGRVGLKHHANSVRNVRRLPSRAVRVGCELPCKVWIGDRLSKCFATNISQTGALINDLEGVEIGVPITIEIGGQIIYNAQVRWTRSGRSGVQFPKPVPMRFVLSILEAA